MKAILLLLSCADEKEANTISQYLLEQKLAACVKQLPIKSAYWWHGEIEHADETLLLIESISSKFNAIEKEVKKLHSYKKIVLLQVPVEKVSAEVLTWLGESITDDSSNS